MQQNEEDWYTSGTEYYSASKKETGILTLHNADEFRGIY